MPGSETLRLFPEVPRAALARRDAEGYFVVRLLAEGDSRDLHALFPHRSEASVRQIFRRRSRQLSRRDRAFWSLLLATEAENATPLSEQLWPL